MAVTTIDDVQSRVAAIVDQNEDASDISTADYSLRLSYINRRERMWAETGKWQALHKEYNVVASASSGNCSVALPNDFRRLASPPVITFDGSTTANFQEIRPQIRSRFSDTTDRYVMILGNEYDGFNMYVNPATSSGVMTSGASIKIHYFSNPSSHASPANTVYCPNPDYVVQGVIADIWEAREDARFQQAQVKANLILQNMLEYEFTPSEADFDRNVRSIDQSRHDFRWGRD
jgi:hypothetical protein